MQPTLNTFAVAGSCLHQPEHQNQICGAKSGKSLRNCREMEFRTAPLKILIPYSVSLDYGVTHSRHCSLANRKKNIETAGFSSQWREKLNSSHSTSFTANDTKERCSTVATISSMKRSLQIGCWSQSVLSRCSLTSDVARSNISEAVNLDIFYPDSQTNTF